MQNFLFKRLFQTTFKSNPFSSPQSHSPLFKFLASGLGATGLGSVFYHYNDMKNFSNKNNFTEMDQTQIPDHVFKDLAKGTIYGALCGDSIGSYVEFEDYVSGPKAEHALTMPGGGPFSLAKGQITDDGELALCLGQGLVDGKGEFDVERIAENYKKWIASNPFDVGITIGTAFHWANPAGLAKGYRKSSLQSGKSQSNGALMRISPLCVWVAKLNKEDLKKCVREDTRLTHPNQTAIDVSIAYVYAIQHLLNHKGDSEGAYKKAFEMIKELENPEVEEWLRELEKGELPPANEKIGWVKIAFLYSLQFLKQKKGYADAMKTMLEQAGDTDTNCCIVGAMLGALHGFDAIPKEMTDAVRTCNPAAGGIRRPDFLLAEKSLDKIIDNILETMPKGEVVIKGAETEEEKAENNKKTGWF